MDLGNTGGGYGYGTVMATGLPDAFSRKTLFLLESLVISLKPVHNVHQVGVYIGCTPGGASCHISDFMLVSSFQMTLCVKCYFSQTIGMI